MQIAKDQNKFCRADGGRWSTLPPYYFVIFDDIDMVHFKLANDVVEFPKR